MLSNRCVEASEFEHTVDFVMDHQVTAPRESKGATEYQKTRWFSKMERMRFNKGM